MDNKMITLDKLLINYNYLKFNNKVMDLSNN